MSETIQEVTDYIKELKEEIWDLLNKIDEYETKIIMLNWLKSVLEVYETGGTYKKLDIRIKQKYVNHQEMLKVIKEWLDERES